MSQPSHLLSKPMVFAPRSEFGCAPKTRNTRLAALRAFFRFVAYAEPDRSLQCQQVLAIPTKRHERPMLEFLNC